MERVTIAANGLEFSCLTEGAPDAPLLLFLHGFPEYSGAWEEILPRLSDAFFCVAPDQRGYNLSSKPAEVDAYRGGKVAADALALIEALRPGGQARAVIGHDWGAGAAYAAAMRGPQAMEKLVILNGVHPIPFQRAILRDPAQRRASQYIRFLRRPDSHEKMAADDFAGVMKILNEKMDTGWLTGARLQAYKDAWAEGGALKHMIHWYRAAGLLVPEPDEVVDEASLPAMDPALMRIRMPHLLIWGMGDSALLPSAREGLEDLCDDLRVVEIEEADHWIAHQKPDEVAGLIRAFAG